jgi:acetyltransferase
MLHRFTHIDYDNQFALVSVIEDDGRDAIIAVGRYAYDSNDDHTDLAVAVRDDWQHLGLGKSVLAKTVAIGKEHGISRFRSMMHIENKIIKRILLELGYEVKYSLRSGLFEVDILV